MKAERDAKAIAAERMEKIAQQQALLAKLSPQLVADAQNFKNVFGSCRVLNTRPRPKLEPESQKRPCKPTGRSNRRENSAPRSGKF